MKANEEVTDQIPLSPRPTAWRLEIQDEDAGFAIPLAEGRSVQIGSSRRSDVVVADSTVSGQHIAIAVVGNGVHVKDLDSRNGTYVGGARVHEAWGGPGTIINIGCTSVLVQSAMDPIGEIDPMPLPGVIGASQAMQRVAAKVRRLASRRAPVLILGESGTGKELIARALHEEGKRKAEPFVALNVSAMPRELVESELFGHERGAFTGAVSKRAGAFHEACGGTLFLDEIGDLPLEVQPKLLRALDGYEIRRVGASGSGDRSEARVVAATNVELEQQVEEGLFRRDLFHRLEVFVILVPPLRERRGDVCAIAKKLVRRLEGEGPRNLTTGALSALAVHHWPGNVRELTNALVRAADLARDENVIDAAHVVQAMSREPLRLAGLTPSLAKAIYESHQRNLSAAARAAGVPRTTFRKLITR
jgi:transcriptional regulator with GAF, ATPase, and Fis domain